MLKGIKSKLILNKICSNLNKKPLLKLIKYNSKMKSLLNISLNDYMNYNKIIIEMIPRETIEGIVKIIDYEEKNKFYYHIYFNDDNIEIKNRGIIGFIKNLFKKTNYISKIDNVKKIKVIIDGEINSLKCLFKDCKCLKEINFIQFNNNKIKDMSDMFSGCSSLEKLNILNIKTDKVTNMENMFRCCNKLVKLDLKNFKTNNVRNMKGMFYGCSLLEDLNFLIFDTSNVTKMNDMFYNCTYLKELNVYNIDGIPKEKDIKIIHEKYPLLNDFNILNFKTFNVIDMSFMFDSCYSLKKFHIINFDTSKVKIMNRIFCGCESLNDFDLTKFVINKETSVYCSFANSTQQLINKIKQQNMDINENAFGMN